VRAFHTVLYNGRYIKGKTNLSSRFGLTTETWFLPHDAIHRADYAVARCPSVCPSHADIL